MGLPANSRNAEQHHPSTSGRVKGSRFDGLLNHARTNHADGNPAADNLAIFHQANPLQILAEIPFGDARRFATVTTQVFGFTTLAQAIAHGWFVVAVQRNQAITFGVFAFFVCTHVNILRGNSAPIPAGETFLPSEKRKYRPSSKFIKSESAWNSPGWAGIAGFTSSNPATCRFCNRTSRIVEVTPAEWLRRVVLEIFHTN